MPSRVRCRGSACHHRQCHPLRRWARCRHRLPCRGNQPNETRHARPSRHALGHVNVSPLTVGVVEFVTPLHLGAHEAPPPEGQCCGCSITARQRERFQDFHDLLVRLQNVPPGRLACLATPVEPGGTPLTRIRAAATHFNEGRTTNRQRAILLATNGQLRDRLWAESHGPPTAHFGASTATRGGHRGVVPVTHTWCAVGWFRLVGEEADCLVGRL